MRGVLFYRREGGALQLQRPPTTPVSYLPGGFTSLTVAPCVSLRMRRENFSTLFSSAGLSIW